MRMADRVERDENMFPIFVRMPELLDNWFRHTRHFRFASNAEVSFMARYLLCLGKQVAVLRENGHKTAILCEAQVLTDHRAYEGKVKWYVWDFAQEKKIPFFLIHGLDATPEEHLKWFNIKISRLMHFEHVKKEIVLSWVFQRNQYAEFFQEETNAVDYKQVHYGRI